MSMSYLDKIDKTHVPKHVAIIMDGNGRWAKSLGKDRSYGHMEGAVSVRYISEAAREAGVSYLTLYGFSTENWNRPESEVLGLMDLMIHTIDSQTSDMIDFGVRFEVIGDLYRLPENVRNKALKCINDTSKGDKLTLILALSYSSRWEITEAAKSIAHDVKENKLLEEDINEK